MSDEEPKRPKVKTVHYRVVDAEPTRPRQPPSPQQPRGQDTWFAPLYILETIPEPFLATTVQTETMSNLLGRLVRASGLLMDAMNNWNSLVSEMRSAGEAYNFPVPLSGIRLQPDLEEVEWEENPLCPNDLKGKGNALQCKTKGKKGKKQPEGNPDSSPPSPRPNNDDSEGGGSGVGEDIRGRIPMD